MKDVGVGIRPIRDSGGRPGRARDDRRGKCSVQLPDAEISTDNATSFIPNHYLLGAAPAVEQFNQIHGIGHINNKVQLQTCGVKVMLPEVSFSGRVKKKLRDEAELPRFSAFDSSWRN